MSDKTEDDCVGHVDPEIRKLYTRVLDDVSKAAMDRLAESTSADDEKDDDEEIAGSIAG